MGAREQCAPFSHKISLTLPQRSFHTWAGLLLIATRLNNRKETKHELQRTF